MQLFGDSPFPSSSHAFPRFCYSPSRRVDDRGASSIRFLQHRDQPALLARIGECRTAYVADTCYLCPAPFCRDSKSELNTSGKARMDILCRALLLLTWRSFCVAWSFDLCGSTLRSPRCKVQNAGNAQLFAEFRSEPRMTKPPCLAPTSTPLLDHSLGWRKVGVLHKGRERCQPRETTTRPNASTPAS